VTRLGENSKSGEDLHANVFSLRGLYKKYKQNGRQKEGERRLWNELKKDCPLMDVVVKTEAATDIGPQPTAARHGPQSQGRVSVKARLCKAQPTCRVQSTDFLGYCRACFAAVV
jgi:hypothetical protein